MTPKFQANCVYTATALRLHGNRSSKGPPVALSASSGPLHGPSRSVERYRRANINSTYLERAIDWPDALLSALRPHPGGGQLPTRRQTSAAADIRIHHN